MYCYCQQPEDDENDMIGCDFKNCKIEWFHLKCLKIKKVPNGKWFCPDCRKLPPSANEEERKKNENIIMDEHIIMYTVKLQSNFIVIILATSVPS